MCFQPSQSKVPCFVSRSAPYPYRVNHCFFICPCCWVYCWTLISNEWICLCNSINGLYIEGMEHASLMTLENLNWKGVSEHIGPVFSTQRILLNRAEKQHHSFPSLPDPNVTPLHQISGPMGL
nr:hypothetical protein Q903MT_gene5098 [Picea sitchensis]